MNSADIGIVQPIEFAEFRVGLTDEDTLVTEAGEGRVKSPKSREEVDESQGLCSVSATAAGRRSGTARRQVGLRATDGSRTLADVNVGVLPAGWSALGSGGSESSTPRFYGSSAPPCGFWLAARSVSVLRGSSPGVR